MGDSGNSGARLEVSVSFGRFENDALSWEKWSSFSPNKYLEEVGSLSTPGSVAQKKAYFEAHYRKIAAKKAEELELEKLMNPVILRQEDCAANSGKNDTEFGLSSGEKLVDEVANVSIVEEAKDDNARSSEMDEQGVCMNGLIDSIALEEEIEGAGGVVKCESAVTEEAKDVLDVNVGNNELNVSKDAALVGLETPHNDSRCVPQERKNGVERLKKENSKLNARNIAQKVTPIKKERNSVGTKKKVVSPAAKPLPLSTPRYVKPTSISTPISASQSSKKNVNGSKSKNSVVGESKRAAPTSLHMSLSLGPSDSLGALSMTRKSLIMESMGDKDIVKRAFKTFQNRTNGSMADEKPSTAKNVSTTAFEPRMSSYHTPAKGNEGLRKDADKRSSQRSQSGPRSNPLPSGSRKSSALDKKSTMALSAATSLRSEEKAEKRKEFIKKLGAKTLAREAENAQRSAKSKVTVENETRPRPTLNR